MKVKYIYDFIDSFAPFRDQCEWDNSGLLLGDMNCDFSKIGFSLDITGETVDNAIAEGCDLIVTHHPVIFRPVNSIGYDSLVSKLIKNNISVISAHTNLDKSPLGVNFVLAEKCSLVNARRFPGESDASMCFIGEIKETNASDYARFISDTLSTHVEFTCPDRIISSVAVCGGAGGEFLYEIAPFADAFVTGEVKHHEFIDGDLRNLTFINAGHFATEYPVIPYLCEKTFKETGAQCLVLKQKNPCEYIGD